MLSSFTEPEADEVEPDVLMVGRGLIQDRRRLGTPAHQARNLLTTVIAQNDYLRGTLFRLVDVAPGCATPGELAEHLEAYLGSVEYLPASLRMATRLLGSPRSRAALGRLTSLGITSMSKRFIVGRSISEALPFLARLWASGAAATVDLLGEATVTFEEARRYARRCEQALFVLSNAASQWNRRPLLERDGAGALPRANLSVKVTGLTPLARPHAPERAHADAAGHLSRLLARARDLDAHLHIDMESFDSRELVLDLVLDLLSRDEFAAGPSAGVVVQSYLRDSEETLQAILEWAARVDRSVPLTVRLVKGAYWDHEMILAGHHGWSPPVWTHKLESDRCFERLSGSLIDSYPLVRPAIASHNPRSVAHALAYARRCGLGPGDIEVQVLRGLGDRLQQALTRAGERCRMYCPVGDLVEGMAYLVRRLLENTSNSSFLATNLDSMSLTDLLRRP